MHRNGQNKTPRPGRDRGRKHFAVPPLVRRLLTKAASCRSIRRRRVNGRTRSTPTAFCQTVQVPAPRCIPQPSLSPFHQPGVLFAGTLLCTSPLPRCIRVVLYRINTVLSTENGEILRFDHLQNPRINFIFIGKNTPVVPLRKEVSRHAEQQAERTHSEQPE